jgi:hypothetical protein
MEFRTFMRSIASQSDEAVEVFAQKMVEEFDTPSNEEIRILTERTVKAVLRKAQLFQRTIDKCQGRPETLQSLFRSFLPGLERWHSDAEQAVHWALDRIR